MKTKLSVGALLVLVSVLTTALQLQAQNAPRPPAGTGRIVGRVLDAQTGAGLSSVNVEVVNSGIGTLSGADGRFSIVGVPSGSTAVRVSSIGYATRTLADIVVTAEEAVQLNVTLEQQAVVIGAIEVTAGAAKGSVNRSLDQQRTATGIVSAISAEQMARSGDADAAAAVQRIAGVSLMDNKYVQVRGLGERYTTTSLNGARIPSPEPEKKIVPLDIFPAGLLETITTSKTFTPDQSGDFTGAQVDIKTREFPAGRTQSFSTSFGYNSAASGRTMLGAPTTGMEWLAFGKTDRALPDLVRSFGNFQAVPTQDQVNQMVNSFRNVWVPRDGTGRPNGSASASIGGNTPLSGQRIGYALAGTYSYSQEVRDDEVRAQARPSIDGSVEEINRYTGSTGRSSVLWGGVLNASTLFGAHSRISMNATYNRSADNEARSEFGSDEQYANTGLQVNRLRYVERSVGSAQLAGEHEFGTRHRVTWSGTYSRVDRSEPDRSELVYAYELDANTNEPLPRAWFSSAAEGAVRTFADLSESAAEFGLNYRLGFGESRQSGIKLGGLMRDVARTADNQAYSISAPTMRRADRELDAAQIFDGRFSRPGQNILRVMPLSQGGSYEANDRLVAGYAMLELGLTDRLRLITGARVEHSNVEVVTDPTLGERIRSNPTYTDVLPAFTLNYQLTDNQNLRFSASQTLSRPEYRELSPTLFREVLAGDNVRGNADLERSLIRNFDLRWELYPSTGETFSVALFAKDFENPIERIYLGTSGTRMITFMNADGARNYGVELEARKNFGFLSESLLGLTAFMNATLMRSEIELSGIDGGMQINKTRPMVGQSPYVINAGANYVSESGDFSAMVLYNLFGKRIVNAAEVPMPDVYEQARHAIDVSLRFPLLSGVSAKLDVKNVLDSPYEVRQGEVLREYYRSGRVFTFGLNWRL